jgi:hypothetical protein
MRQVIFLNLVSVDFPLTVQFRLERSGTTPAGKEEYSIVTLLRDRISAGAAMAKLAKRETAPRASWGFILRYSCKD